MDHTHEVTGSNPVSPSLPAPSRPSRAGDCLKPTQASLSGSHATPTKKPRILDTFLRALETLAQLAPEVTALDEELAGREEEVLRRVLELVRPILPRLARPIILKEPGLDGATAAGGSPGERRWRDDGIVVTKKFQQDRDVQDRSQRYSASAVVLVAPGKLVEIEETARWSERETHHRDAVWRIESREVEPSPHFARENLKRVLASLLDALTETIKREHGRRKDLLSRLTLVEEAHKALSRTPAD